ncbi:tail collar fiber protein [Escherichia phage EcS1]|uniref:Short tail fiber protein n=1 Tax=Escherichia phage EcS1 TaxID=2083276 RepID=A0A2Z5ZCL6_9CAUD|nr:tail collar fiber protein [Escherichia phage EcS1]BBC78227.1 Short tail fiber protein [Escherichia phage EcS1]
MATNTIAHISDDSRYKTFDPAGTSFPGNITNVQAALAALKPIAVDGIPDATTTVKGIIRISTQQEVTDGVDTTSAVTPATLAVRLQHPQATETVLGITRYSTLAETKAGTISNAAVVPSTLKGTLDEAFTVRTSSETVLGVIKLSTTPAALAGVDDTTAMTPLKTTQAINAATAKIPSPAVGNETVTGLLRLATAAETRAGTFRDGVAVSPFGLMSLRSSATEFGIVKGTSQAEVAAGAITNQYVSPQSLLGLTGNTGRLGLVKLTTTAGAGDANTALAFNADVVHLRGGQTINGSLVVGGNFNTNRIDMTSGFINGQQIMTTNMITDDVPVGCIMMWPTDNLPNGKWRFCHGGTLPSASFPTYYNTVGTTYGGDGGNAGIPDMRGLFVRGTGRSAMMAAFDGNDSKGKQGLGYGCSGAGIGQVQAQQNRVHKHESGWGEHYQRGEARNGCSVYSGQLGSNKTDWDNYKYFTNDGQEVEAANVRDSWGTMNTENLMGWENRPWNISMNYIIKVA